MALAVSRSQGGLHTLPLPGVRLAVSVPAGGILDPRLYFDPSQLSEPAATRYAERIRRVMSPSSAHAVLSTVPMMGAEERRFVSSGCNLSAGPQLSSATVHAAFSAIAQAHPDAVALCSHHGAPLLTYAALEQASMELASGLLQLGTLSEQRRMVGLLYERSVAMVVGVMGTLMSGGAYLPIDPGFPLSRIGAMVGEAHAAALVLGGGQADVVRGLVKAAYIDPVRCPIRVGTEKGVLKPVVSTDATAQLPVSSTAPAAVPASYDDTVYVMYTSGTTGRPKGVRVTHGPLLKRVGWMGRAYPCGVGDRITFKTQFIFGVSEFKCRCLPYVSVSFCSLIALTALMLVVRRGAVLHTYSRCHARSRAAVNCGRACRACAQPH